MTRMKTFLSAPLAIMICASGCVAPSTASPPQVVDLARDSTTITIEVHTSHDLALFLFSYHAARSLSDRELRNRRPLSAKDAALLSDHAEAFVPVYAAFQPYLDAHPLFDRNMLFMGANLTGGDVEFPDPAVSAAMDAFRPTYEAYFAPAHRTATDRYRTMLESQIAQYGDAMARAVARELSGEWRVEPIRIDVVPYATRIGAYTNSHHTVISASQPDYRTHALEMAFHEAAHTDPIFSQLREVAAEALEANGLEELRFWHYLQFYGVGRAARSVLGEDYVPYHEATGLSSRSAKPWYDAIAAVWDDHDTLRDRAHAAAALIAAREAS